MKQKRLLIFVAALICTTNAAAFRDVAIRPAESSDE
jgi:hypothetical protein